MDPKKMQAMMKQMGIAQEDIPATRVIIEQPDKKIIIENPSVVKVKMQGNESFQISGEVNEESQESEPVGISEEDINTIIEKTNATDSQARAALEKTGDLAEAIMELS
jgi:alpha-NAC-related protein